jgi:iron complex transport system ATP-binding protein
MLDVDDLAFGFPGKRIGESVSLQVGPGTTLAVLGGNGAGKTTLLRTLLGLLPPLAGRISIDGADVAAMAPPDRARRVAYVPQQHAPPFAFSVEDVVVMGRVARAAAFARPAATDRAAARDALGRFGIASLATRSITELSGGERQLVLVARALAQDTPLIVLDEPTASLDYGNRARVLRELDRLRNAGLGIVFSTHEPDHALVHADRALLLAGGAPLACGDASATLTARNVSRLYGLRVELVTVDATRRIFVAA